MSPHPPDYSTFEAMLQAFGAIHDEALRLQPLADQPEAVREGLDLISSIARYHVDVRTESERSHSRSVEDPPQG